MSDYDDIIDIDWPQQRKRERMNVALRAKIFLPFAALTGYDKALQETQQKEIASMEQKTVLREDEAPYVI